MGAAFRPSTSISGCALRPDFDEQTLEIRLHEIERAAQRTGVKPNFIVLGRGLLGWQPLPSRIPRGIRRAAASDGRGTGKG